MQVTRELLVEAMKRFYRQNGKEANVVYFPQDQLEELLTPSDQWGTAGDTPPRTLVGMKTIYHDGPLRFAYEPPAAADDAVSAGPKYNTMIDLACTVEHNCDDAEDIPVAAMCDAMQKRLDYIRYRDNPTDAAEAFGICDTYEIDE